VALTTDAWTSRANQGYLSYTAHFVTPNFCPKSYCLSVENSESHTAPNLATSLKDCATKWTSDKHKTTTNKLAVVSENASNIQSAVGRLPTICTPLNCFDHPLQLVINHAVKSCTVLQEATLKAKSITTHFKHSSQKTKALLELEDQLKLPKLKLKQECLTRWNSRYEMLERMVTVKCAVSRMTASEKKLQPLSAEEWQVAEEYAKIFKPFKVATALMKTFRYPTISMVIPELNKLKYFLKTGAVQSNSMPTLNEELLATSINAGQIMKLNRSKQFQLLSIHATRIAALRTRQLSITPRV